MRDIAVISIVFGSLPIILFRPWIGILMWSWIGYMNPHKLAWGIATSMPLAMVIGIATLVGLLFTKERKGVPLRGEMLVVLVLTIYFTITTFYSWVPDSAWIQWEKVMKILLMTFVTTMLIYGRKKIRLLMITIVISIGFYGVKGGVFSILTGGQYRIWGPEQTFLGGNNEIGLAMIMILPIMYFLSRDEENAWVKRGLLIAMGLTVIAVIFTYSRGALLGLCSILLLLFFKLKKKWLVAILLLPLIIFGIRFLPSGIITRAETIQSFQEDHSAMQRIQSWSVAWNVAKENPLTGGGFDLADVNNEKWLSYASFMGDWHNRARAAHSIYFQILGEHGFVGLFLFLMVMIMTFSTLREIRKSVADDQHRQWLANYAAGIQIGLSGYAISGAFLSMAYFDLFYAFIAITAILSRELSEGEGVGHETALRTGSIQKVPTTQWHLNRGGVNHHDIGPPQRFN